MNRPTPNQTPPATLDIKDEYLTPAQLSALLNIPKNTLSAWRTQRKGPLFYRLGVHVRYPRTHLASWFAELEGEARTWMAS